MRRMRLAPLLVLALVVAGMPAAAAKGGIVDRVNISESFEDVEEEFLSDVCGLAVTVSGVEKLDIRTFADGSVKDHLVLQQTFSSGLGSVDFVINSMIHFEPEQFVDNGDGTGTVSIPHSENVMVRIQEPGSAPSSLDAGQIQWFLELTVDLETGELVDVHEEILGTNGRFDLLFGGSALDQICDALNG